LDKDKGKSISYEFRRQAEALRKGRSWDEAGITSPNDPPEVRNKKISDWLGKAQNVLTKTYNQAVKQSKALNKARVNELHEIIRKPAGADGGLTPRQQERVTKLIDEIRSIPQGNNETLKTITERSPR
jgi:predicted metal-dependent hydrolase